MPGCSGPYLAGIYGDGRAPGDRVFLPVERVIYRVCGVDEKREQRWNVYALSLLAFSLFSVVLLFAIQRLQGSLPLNPTDVGAVPVPLAWNTAVSFVTNTNWQNYAGESTMSHLTQMAGLAVQNFVSPVVGICVVVALIRGLARRRAGTVGNFWVDLVRGTVRLMIPLAIVCTLVLLSQGAIQNLRGFTSVQTVEGANQVIPGGPFASQEAIKELGTNGGGQLNANSAHPLLNVNGFTNLFQIVMILLIPFALAYAYGRFVKDKRQGWVIVATMFLLWIGSVALATGMEVRGNERLTAVGRQPDRDGRPGRRQHGGQGGPLRLGRLRRVRGLHHGHLHRRRQLRARLDDAAGRHGPAVQHDAGRGQPGRRRRRPLRHVDLRPPGGVHRRADGGADARVPRQEDPGRRDEARRALHPGRAGGGALLHRRLARARHSARHRSSTRDRTGSPRSPTPSRRPRTTTAAPSVA